MAEKSLGRPRKGPLDPPAGLDRAARLLWRLTIVQLGDQGTWADSDLPLLERYIRSVEVARHARGRIERRAKSNPAEAYVTRGSQGQLVQHPDLKTAREAERDANDYAQDLLLSPKSRRQHDIKPQSGRPGKLESILGGLAEPSGARAPGGAKKRGG